jgi:hypothetical protein
MFQLSLVLYLSQVCLHLLIKVPGSQRSEGLWLCSSHHLGSSSNLEILNWRIIKPHSYRCIRFLQIWILSSMNSLCLDAQLSHHLQFSWSVSYSSRPKVPGLHFFLCLKFYLDICYGDVCWPFFFYKKDLDSKKSLVSLKKVCVCFLSFGIASPCWVFE